MLKVRWLRGLIVGAAAAGATLALGSLGAFGRLELKSWDARMQAFADPGRASREIVLVLVDQYSLDLYEKAQSLTWPWPREIYGVLVRYLDAGGAKALFFDMTMTEGSRWGPEDDAAFAAAVAEAGNVVLPLFLSEEDKESDAARLRLLRRFSAEPPAALVSTESFRSATLPLENFLEAARAVANVRVNPDEDTIYRRLPLWQKFREMTIPTVPWALASIVRPGLDPARIPVDRQGRLIVRYFGPTGTYKTYPIASLINSYARMQEGRVPEVAPTDFAGKIVLVGLSAVGLYDIKASPLSGVVPGIEIQAAALDTLLNGLSFLLPSPTVGTGYLLALGLLAAVAVSLFRRTAVQVVGFVIFLLAPAAAGALAFASGWWLDYAAPTAAVLLALIGAAVLNYSLEGRERRFIKGVFRHYLSPPVIERILENPKLLRLGGEEREVTSFFSDIAGFTSLSESLSAHDLVALLNDYLTAMTDVILDAGGTLDKYEGDAIIAFWNAPLDDPDHALRACRAALACQQRLEALRPGFERRFGRGLRMRIGLNTGPAVVGNMGSARRFDYTAMGDTINLAARLEGAAKHYGVSILAGEATVGRAGDAIMSREVDVIRVVGKTRPARIFELIGEADAVPEETRMRLRAYGEALDLYRRRDWAGAASGFAVLPADPVAEVYAKRCRRFAVEEPAADWDFVLDLAAK